MANSESRFLGTESTENTSWIPDASGIAAAFDALASAHNTFVCSQPLSLADLNTWNAIRRCLPVDRNKPVLDVGGGNGLWAIKIAQLGYPVTMVDLSARMLEYAAHNLASAGLADRITLLQLDAHELGRLPVNAFSLVLAVGDVLNYTRRAEQIVEQLKQVCRPGGKILATVIGRGGLASHLLKNGNELPLIRLLMNGDWEERSVEEMAKHSPTESTASISPLRLHAFTPTELSALFANAHLSLERIFARGIVASLLRPQEIERLMAQNGENFLLRWELRLANEPSLLGCASGLGVIAMKM